MAWCPNLASAAVRVLESVKGAPPAPAASGLRRRPHQVPQMPVDIFKTLVVHESLVLGRMGRTATGSDGPGDQTVHFFLAFAAEADDQFVGFLCVGDGLVDQGLENGSVVSMAWM